MNHFDDIGTGRYDFLGITARVPIHAKKAMEFLRAGDRFNAHMHALTCIRLGATGWIGSTPYKDALLVLAQLKGIM